MSSTSFQNVQRKKIFIPWIRINLPSQSFKKNLLASSTRSLDDLYFNYIYILHLSSFFNLYSSPLQSTLSSCYSFSSSLIQFSTRKLKPKSSFCDFIFPLLIDLSAIKPQLSAPFEDSVTFFLQLMNFQLDYFLESETLNMKEWQLIFKIYKKFKDNLFLWEYSSITLKIICWINFDYSLGFWIFRNFSGKTILIY